MIFVSVGTTSFPFDRLLRAVDEAMVNSRSAEELVVQKGVGQYKFNYPRTKVCKELPIDKMITHMKQARIIITHGGPATIFLALRYGQKMPLVVPRSKKFAEHVDNHEVFFAKFLAGKGQVEAIFPGDEMRGKIVKYLGRVHFPPAALSDSVGVRRLVNKLINYTESL